MQQPKYLRIAADIERAILEGSLKAGARLPSVRELMAQRQVSLSTVTAALRKLEEAGLVEPLAKSGYFVRPGKRSRAALSASVDVIDRVEIDTPAPDLYPADRLRKLMASMVRRHPSLAVRPPSPSATRRLAHQVARRSAEIGCFLRETDIVVTQGDVEALSLALRACLSPGDKILVQTPIDPVSDRVLSSLRLSRVPLPDTIRLSEALAQQLAGGTAVNGLLINPSFGFPAGTALDIGERRSILRIAYKAKLPVIEDDRYGDLQHRGVRLPPIRSFDTEGVVTYVGSCCRSIAPGLQIGWVAAEGPRCDAIELMRAASSARVSDLNQLVLAEYLARGSHGPHLRRLRRRLHERVSVMRDLLTRELGLELATTGGYGFLVCLRTSPEPERRAAWKAKWPALFSSTAPMFAFVERDLFVNSSYELSKEQLADVRKFFAALRPSL